MCVRILVEEFSHCGLVGLSFMKKIQNYPKNLTLKLEIHVNL